MNLFSHITDHIRALIQKHYSLSDAIVSSLSLVLTSPKEAHFGDISCNAAMILAKELKKSPRALALELKEVLFSDDLIKNTCSSIEIAGPGFINISFKPPIWSSIVREIVEHNAGYFKPSHQTTEKFLIEFVSANPTGPLHIGHGRNGIIGDVLARVLTFLGHSVTKEFYINDAGNQVAVLGKSFQTRCFQQLGREEELSETSYAGEYLIDLAKECVQEYGEELFSKPLSFFETYAKERMLLEIKKDLKLYRIEFDLWFSEKTLFENGEVEKTMHALISKGFAYEAEGALWFKSTAFGDEKDRVLRKSDGAYTYIAPDIAYHKNKYDRGNDHIIDILGQDHHGYLMRLRGTLEALGYDPKKLDFILYQLVSIKNGDVAVKMSKRAGTFTTLRDIIEAVGVDVARFFYLNRKADAHLEFDIQAALQKSDENPVFYIHYAYVRLHSILTKASEKKELELFINDQSQWNAQLEKASLEKDSISLIKKCISLPSVLEAIGKSYQTHQLAYYTLELAQSFHNYYAHHRIISDDVEKTKNNLILVHMVKTTLGLGLDILGLSKPESM